MEICVPRCQLDLPSSIDCFDWGVRYTIIDSYQEFEFVWLSAFDHGYWRTCHRASAILRRGLEIDIEFEMGAGHADHHQEVDLFLAYLKTRIPLGLANLLYFCKLCWKCNRFCPIFELRPLQQIELLMHSSSRVDVEISLAASGWISLLTALMIVESIRGSPWMADTTESDENASSKGL